MFAFLGRTDSIGGKDESRRRNSPFAGSPEASRNRVVGQAVAEDDFDEDEEDEDADEFSPLYRRTSYFDRRVTDAVADDEDDADGEDAVDTPLLPIFSAAHLDKLHLYNITHATRLLIVQKMRDNTLVGAASKSTDQSIPGEAYSEFNSDESFQSSKRYALSSPTAYNFKRRPSYLQAMWAY